MLAPVRVSSSLNQYAHNQEALSYGRAAMQSVVHGALRKRVWIVIVSSCATQRLRKAVVLVVLLGGVPPSTASTALEAARKFKF